MDRSKLLELLLHNFPENGSKYLLHNAGNLEDTLRLLAQRYTTLPDVTRFDCARRSIEPDTFIRPDFSHGITDLLLRVPLRLDDASQQEVRVYLLFEHLSKHQRHITPRSLSYVMDAYRAQERRWLGTHETLQGLLYEAVVPIVFHTGERVWSAPTPFHKVVAGGDVLRPLLPALEPLLLSVPGQSEQTLLQHGGAFGRVLRVLQQRSAAADDFHAELVQAVQTLEARLSGDPNRLVELLSYLTALVYHSRKPGERADMQRELERAIQTRTIQRETETVGKTIAQALMEEGERKGKREGRLEGKLEAKRETLVLLLREKFGKKVTAEIAAHIEETTKVAQLNAWLRKVLKANSLDELGVLPEA